MGKVPWSAITSIVLNTEDERKATKAKQQEESAQQDKLIFWTRLSVLVSIPILLVYMLTLIEVKRSADTAVCALRQNQDQFTKTLAKMKESNEINRESLESVQRAFIAFQNVNIVRGKNGASGEFIWDIQPVFQNTGNTPALQAVTNATFLPSKDDKIPESVFRNGNPMFRGNLIPASIAPKALQGIAAYRLGESYIFGVQLGENFENWPKPIRKDMYVFGWMVYRDVMPGTKPHLTEFCKRLYDAGLVFNPVRQVRFTDVNCPQYNCTDEYCADYAQIVAYADSRTAK